MIWPPVGLVFAKLGNLSIYQIWSIQASEIPLASSLNSFGTSLFGFEIFQSYYFNAIYTGKQPMLYAPDWYANMLTDDPCNGFLGFCSLQVM